MNPSTYPLPQDDKSYIFDKDYFDLLPTERDVWREAVANGFTGIVNDIEDRIANEPVVGPHSLVLTHDGVEATIDRSVIGKSPKFPIADSVGYLVDLNIAPPSQYVRRGIESRLRRPGMVIDPKNYKTRYVIRGLMSSISGEVIVPSSVFSLHRDVVRGPFTLLSVNYCPIGKEEIEFLKRIVKEGQAK